MVDGRALREVAEVDDAADTPNKRDEDSMPPTTQTEDQQGADRV